jgi:replicative DNA helicase/DNA primase
MEQVEIDEMMTNLQSYLEMKGINTSRLFRCLNPNHNDSKASMKYFDDNKIYCFGCGACYNLVDVISIMEGLDKKEAFKKAIKDYGPTNQKVQKPVKVEVKQDEKDYEKAINFWKQNFDKTEEAKKYIQKRGISEETAKKFGLGYNSFNFGEFKLNAVIIPINNKCFTARNIGENEDKIRYYKPKGCHTSLFNASALTNEIPYCVVTEGEFDCMSFDTIGINAMALCSANNVQKFKNENKSNDKTYILALDNDSTGQSATKELEAYFDENGITYVEFDNCGYKDANKALSENKAEFVEKITNLVKNLSKTEEKCSKKKENEEEM